MKSQACTGGGESLVAHTYPASARPCSQRCVSGPAPQGLPLRGPIQALCQSCVVGQPQGEDALAPPFSWLFPDTKRHGGQIGSLALLEGMAPQCLCFSQVPSFAILLVGCREPGGAWGTLFRGGVWRFWGSRGVSRAPCSPQYWPVVDVDVASDSHRPAGDMNAVGTCGKGSRVRGADG